MTNATPGSGKPQLECDIVMAGGVTSGIIYPGAIAMIARRYTFRSIGGTSVGAIAAAATGAAEYGRVTGRNPNGFDTLAALPKTLSELAGDGHSRLFHLFTPERATEPLLSLVTPLFGGGGFLKHAIGIVSTTMKTWQIALATIAGVVAAVWMWIVLFCAGNWFLLLIGALAALTLIFVVWALALFGTLYYRWLPAFKTNYFGICTGGTQFGPAKTTDQAPFDGLSLWIHKVVQQAAGRSVDDDPMTFGDLWGASPKLERQTDSTQPRVIDLAMISSDISRNRSVQLPFIETPTPIYVETAVLEAYLPPQVVKWMQDKAGDYGNRVEQKAGVIRLPKPADWPLVFAARLSLSFPVLLSAFPLMTPNFAVAKRGQPVSLHRLWLSDGGLTSNFPIHFFDSPVPSRPTFCLNLIDYDAGVGGAASSHDELDATEGTAAPDKPITQPRSELRRSDRIPNRAPDQEPQPNDDVWGYISMAPGNRLPPPSFNAFDEKGAGLLSFANTLLNTARFWSDNQMLIAPGFRDRVVNIALRDNEGGLNLDMPEKTINDLNFRGKAAGMLVAARYDPGAAADPETGGPNHETFPNHRWVRFRNYMAAFQDTSRRFVNSRRASDTAATARGESELAKMIDGTAPEPLGYQPTEAARPYYEKTVRDFEALAIAMAEATRADPEATFDAQRTFGPSGGADPKGAAPRPKMRFQLRPLAGNDPNVENAQLP